MRSTSLQISLFFGSGDVRSTVYYIYLYPLHSKPFFSVFVSDILKSMVLNSWSKYNIKHYIKTSYLTNITVLAEQGKCEHRYSNLGYYQIISLKASCAIDTSFSRAFHITSQYDFHANNVRPCKEERTDRWKERLKLYSKTCLSGHLY